MLRLIIRVYSWTVYAQLSGAVASSHRPSKSPMLPTCCVRICQRSMSAISLARAVSAWRLEPLKLRLDLLGRPGLKIAPDYSAMRRSSQRSPPVSARTTV